MKKLLFLSTLFITTLASGQGYFSIFGDSNGAGGFGAPAANCFSGLLNSELGFTVQNHAVPGTQINAFPGQLATAAGDVKNRWAVVFGANDANLQTVIDQTWYNNYAGYIQQAISQGWQPAKGFLITPPYTNVSFQSNPNHLNNLYAAAQYIRQLGTQFGIKVVDPHAYMKWAYELNGNAAYKKPAGYYNGDDMHFNVFSHRIITDMIRVAIYPLPPLQAGAERVKAFGAGSMVTAVWKGTNFVEEWASETGRSCANHGTIGSVVDYHNVPAFPADPTDTLDLDYQARHRAEGVKDFALLFFGQNDHPNNAAQWGEEYKRIIVDSFIASGYLPSHIILSTIPRKSDLQTSMPPDWYSTITACNQQTRQIAAVSGATLFDADLILASLPGGQDQYFGDNVHINDLGQRVLADRLKCLFPATGSTLPVKLLSFSATKTNQSVLLNWHAIEETNFDHFEIERSADGAIFQKIGRVGLCRCLGYYQFLDLVPINGQNFYRLKMIDQDAKFSYSPIVRMQIASGNAIIEVFNVAGVLIRKIAPNEVDRFKSSITTPGIYYFRYTDSGNSWTETFLKQNL